jgi:hypothetical protein
VQCKHRGQWPQPPKIAVFYDVHRVTVVRRVWTAGETLLDELCVRFRKKLGITPREFDRMARLRSVSFNRNGRAAGGEFGPTVT